MAEDLPALYAVDFSERERERLAGVSFGEGIYGDLVTEWLLGSDCQESMERGTRVWLFESEDNQIVGVGSLGVSRRPWPPPRGDYRTILLIPMFGVTAPFQGSQHPASPHYSERIFQYILSEVPETIAMLRENGSNSLVGRLVAYVHESNYRALRFWQRMGFEIVPDARHHGDHHILQMWVDNDP